MNYVYLDNAATSFPKPRSVTRAVNACITRYCGNAGRGAHYYAMESARKIYECRELISDFFGVGAPERVIFTQNTTHAINTFIKGCLRQGDHVIISDLEHNAVWRPLYKLAKEGVIEYDVFPSMCGDPRATPTRITAGIARLLKKNTKTVICAHASNICSYSLPIREIGAFCKRHKLLFAVDAAQSAGHLPIDMGEMSIDALCVPAHKGLYGIQGAGFLAISENLSLDTLTEGGNGLLSLEGEMGDSYPEKLESGTLPTPSIVGLADGIRVVKELGFDSIQAHEKALFRYARERLSAIRDITLHCPEYPGAVLLFSHAAIPSEKLVASLGDAGICLRGGYHCAALGHKTLATPEGGAARASFGIFNTSAEIDRLTDALNEILM